MKAIIAALAVLTASPTAAKECYALVDDPSWTITINDPGSDPEWLWDQNGKKIGLWTSGAGTGVPVRVALSEADEGGSYIFYKGALIFDMAVYEPAPCKYDVRGDHPLRSSR